MIQGIPHQGPVHESILFNINLNDFFLLNDIDIWNFADDTTSYVCDVNLKSVLEKLEENSELVVTWFEKTTENEHWWMSFEGFCNKIRIFGLD